LRADKVEVFHKKINYFVNILFDMYVYLAAPLFSQAEREFNEKIKNRLEEEGFMVFLPQEECDENIFECCIENLKKSNVVVGVFDGPQVDDGTAFECGYANALGIPVVGLRTDFRRVGEHTNAVNAMLENCATMCKNLDDVVKVLKEIRGD
jgi:nucleoside 2-deoxyribosyltransferase